RIDVLHGHTGGAATVSASVVAAAVTAPVATTTGEIQRRIGGICESLPVRHRRFASRLCGSLIRPRERLSELVNRPSAGVGSEVGKRHAVIIGNGHLLTTRVDIVC